MVIARVTASKLSLGIDVQHLKEELAEVDSRRQEHECRLICMEEDAERLMVEGNRKAQQIAAIQRKVAPVTSLVSLPSSASATTTTELTRRLLEVPVLKQRLRDYVDRLRELATERLELDSVVHSGDCSICADAVANVVPVDEQRAGCFKTLLQAYSAKHKSASAS